MKNTITAAVVIKAFLLLSFLSSVASAQTFLDRQNADSFRMACYNVYFDTLFESQGIAELTRFVDAVDADVYCFQEAFDTSSAEVQTIFNQIAPLPSGSWHVHKGRNQLTVSRYALSRLETNIPNGTRGIAMAQVDLPDDQFSNDMYILNNHFPCCSFGEDQRIDEAFAIADWMRDAMTVGGNVDLDPNTAIAVVGDLNIVGNGFALDVLIGGISITDWDDTAMLDANPTHNAAGVDDYTWRNDFSSFDPGVLDYILYTDSVISVDHSFVLNPSAMSAEDLAASGLQATDMMRTKLLGPFDFDHLPLIVDFAPNLTPIILGDVNCDGQVDFTDISPFIALLSNGEFSEKADMNLDGSVDFLDISGFIIALS